MTLVFYPVRLPARAHRLPRAGRGHAGDGAQRSAARAGRRSRGVAADGAAVAGRRHLARHDGSAGRLRHRATFGYRTLTEAIYRVWYGMFDRLAATQLASLLLLFALGCSVLERALARPRALHPEPAPRARRPRVPLRAGAPARRRVGCLGVLAAAFVMPVGGLRVGARRLRRAPRRARLRRRAGNTVLLASAAAAVARALALALGVRRAPAAARRSFGCPRASPRMGYALPGAVIAVGVLSRSPGSITCWRRSWSGCSGAPVGLVLTGSAAALVFAYVGALPRGEPADGGRQPARRSPRARRRRAVAGRQHRRDAHAASTCRSCAAACSPRSCSCSWRR